jgi:transcription antitermination factor NusG
MSERAERLTRETILPRMEVNQDRGPIAMKWYAIYTRGGARGVETCAAIAAMEAGVFARVPKIRGYELRNGKRKEKQQAILPGYVLIETPNIGRAMKRLRTYDRFSRYAVDIAGEITAEEMLMLERIEAIGTGAVELIEPGTIKIGEMIEIKDGPLAGQTFAFSCWKKQRGTWRMVVTMKALGRVVSVTIDRDAAQRVRKAAADRRAKG